jgi:3-oxoadipate enol-lactonase
VEVPGARLAVQVTGRPDGPTLVWGHGLSLSMADDDAAGIFDWRSVAEVGRVVRYDARGHGRSTSGGTVDEQRWERLGDDMLAVADAVAAERFVAAGASMGCATSLFAAVQAPERVQALVLVVPPTAWETRAAQAGVYEEDAARAELEGMAAVAQVVASRPVPPLFEPFAAQVRERTIARVSAFEVGRYTAIMRGAAASQLPERDAIAAIEAPALILAWRGDTGHPESTAVELDRLLPTSSLHVAGDLGQVLSWPGLVRAFFDDVIA